uniref:Uncharacterized protein n=1 Tax=Cynodon dactylon TaxID=28909 RepID=Q6PR49_CYNDA|nr:unknown [Cynodon dactylon]
MKSKMVIRVMVLMVARLLLLMATQTVAVGDDSKARRLLGCRYRSCNCRTCPIYGWLCCSSRCTA